MNIINEYKTPFCEIEDKIKKKAAEKGAPSLDGFNVKFIKI